MKNICKKCGKTFGSEKALKQHIKAKHKPYYILTTILPPVVIILLIGITTFTVLPPYLESLRTQTTVAETEGDITDRFLQPGDRLAMHIHVNVRIIVDGNEITIPPGVGIEFGQEKYIHTHDATGLLHIESPINYQFTLGDFFKIWKKRFDGNCFDNFCGEIKVTVNGQEITSPLNYVMNNGDEIVIDVRTK